MPRIFDNIDLALLPALQETLQVADHADFCVGYFNLRGWKQLDSYIERWAGGDGACCRLLVGMQRLPQDDVLDHDACEKLAKWFEGRWDDRWCVDISKEMADIIESSWARPEPLLPYHIYLKIAWHLSQEARAGLVEFRIPKDFGDKLFEFQKAAVKIAAHHLNKRGGVLLGDVVGLGKTLMATAIARIFDFDLQDRAVAVPAKFLYEEQIRRVPPHCPARPGDRTRLASGMQSHQRECGQGGRPIKLVCVYCATEGKPALIGEKEPLDDPRVTHGICAAHQRRLARTAKKSSQQPPPCVREPASPDIEGKPLGPLRLWGRGLVLTPQEAAARLPTRHAETDCLSVPRQTDLAALPGDRRWGGCAVPLHRHKTPSRRGRANRPPDGAGRVSRL